MRIWVIGRNYPLRNNQMQGSFELEQAKMLAKKDELEVAYLASSLHPTKKMRKAGFQRREEDGVSIFTYSKIFMPRVYPLYFGKLRGKIWESFLHKVETEIGLPDVLHLHYPVMMMMADVLEAYKNKGVKIVVTEHWSKVLSKNIDSYELKQLKKYVNVVDQFLCVGSQLVKSIRELTGERVDIRVVPNIVSSSFVPGYEEHSNYTFVAVGRLVKLKQFDKIIEAFSETFRGRNDVRLVLIGGGTEEGNLKRTVNSFDMDKKILMTGQLSKAETAKIVAESDCLVCYSKYETFGVPIVEAWASGIPAIWTNTCGVLEEYDERLGLEISPYDVQELKQAMLYMFSNNDFYNKRNIRAFALEHFAEEVITEKLIRIYNELLAVRE